MRLDIPYCTEIEVKSLKQRIYEDVLKHFDIYNLDVAWKNTLEVQGLKSFRMVFDPFDVKGDPVFFYQQLLVPNNLQFKVDWIKNNIEAVLRSIHLIDSQKSYKLEVRDSLLVRIGKMDDSIKRNHLETTPLQKVLDNYYQVVLSEDFSVRKLSIDQIDAGCQRIEIEPYDEWVEIGPKGSKNMTPIYKQRLLFMIGVNELQDNIEYSFDWKYSEEKLKGLFDFLLQNAYIDLSTSLEDFSEVFSQKPLPEISSPILWTDLGGKNPTEYNTGLIVELIHHLSHIGFIHEKYMNPRDRARVIETCFRMGNGQSFKVIHKRISSLPSRPKKVAKLIDFLEVLKGNLADTPQKSNS